MWRVALTQLKPRRAIAEPLKPPGLLKGRSTGDHYSILAMEKDKQTRYPREEALSDRDTVRLRAVVRQWRENVGPELMLKKPGRSRALGGAQNEARMKVAWETHGW
jgi:hypothetical protein